MGRPILTPVDPIGVGTPACESLSSYVQRLACLNQTVPGQLVYRVLAWYDQASSRKIGRWAARPRRLRIGSNINSFSQADAWTRALQQATGRTGLEYLSTRAWDTQFPTRGFQTSTLAWCPWCLADDEIQYHRLLWALQASSVCSVHRIVLQQRCGGCRRPVPVLHDRSLVARCPWCRGDLRRADRDRQFPASPFALWCADEIGAIVAASSKWQRALVWSAPVKLAGLARSASLANAAAFAAFVGTSKITAWYWLHGRARPSLPFALHIYYRFGRSLADALGCEPSHATTRPPAQPEFHLGKSRSVKTRNWGDIRTELEAHRKVPLSKARALRTIAAAHGLHVRALRAHFPALCRMLANRYRKRTSRERFAQEASLKKQILKAVSQLTRAGIQITPRNLERMMKRPNLFDRRAPRRVLQALKKRMDDVIK